MPTSNLIVTDKNALFLQKLVDEYVDNVGRDVFGYYHKISGDKLSQSELDTIETLQDCIDIVVRATAPVKPTITKHPSFVHIPTCDSLNS